MSYRQSFFRIFRPIEEPGDVHNVIRTLSYTLLVAGCVLIAVSFLMKAPVLNDGIGFVILAGMTSKFKNMIFAVTFFLCSFILTVLLAHDSFEQGGSWLLTATAFLFTIVSTWYLKMILFIRKH